MDPIPAIICTIAFLTTLSAGARFVTFMVLG